MSEYFPSGYERDVKQLMADIIYMINKYEQYNKLDFLADDQRIYTLRLIANDVFESVEWKK